MSVSKKIRFEIFKRDGFICQYCGGSPPDKILEVDHIIPVSKGGTNDIMNLLTSCFDCNRGKRNYELNLVPPTLGETINVIAERELQYRQYKELVEMVQDRINFEINQVELIYSNAFNNWVFSDKFRLSVKKFIKALGYHEVCESMELAILKGLNRDYTLKYFCGICWSKIKENG
jgi:hypothetical protein